jgi:alginate O-acetyltransferase complex protein AlgI
MTEITDIIKRTQLDAWVLMWLIAGALFFACKWLSWRASFARPAARAGRTLGYLVAWPGMDADSFLRTERPAPAPDEERFALAGRNIALGTALLWGAARFVFPHSAHLAGWVGMIGLVLLLHFGLFELAALAWQSAGVNARPIMDGVARANSVGEFWGRRWNRGFSDLSRRFVFEPARRRVGALAGLLLVFVASGLIHELVITVPAGAGFGGPTAYFLIQGIAMLLERSRIARRLGLGRSGRGRAFTAVVTIAPLPLLFPAPFVDRVFVPFMHAIGALGSPQIALSLADAIRIAGLLHFGILIASALVPRVLDWRRELDKLAPLTRHMVWVHGAFIVLTIVGFGVISLIGARELASGSTLARLVCGFIAVFWLLRLMIQFFLFDAKPYLTTAVLKLGYHGLTVVFSILVLTYAFAAIAPRAPVW